MANQVPGSQVDAAPKASPDGTLDPWLKLAQDAFQRSTNYFDANYRKQFEDGIRMFNSKHPRDSKYNSEAYRYRSKVFRPKSRSTVRKHEATASVAFFSNPDVVSIDPVNPDDPMQVASAQVMKELLQYRLTKTIPWYMMLIGAFQDAMTVGLCASFNYWKYHTKTQPVPQMGQDPETGEPQMFMGEQEIPWQDEPCIELIPIENIRFDPAAKWHDVVRTSPYIVVQMPMYLRDVLLKMTQGEWKTLPFETLTQARITEQNPIETSRLEGKTDPKTEGSSVNEFDTLMVHLNFIKVEQDTYCYYTLKDKELLSEPALVKDVFLHGEIPITIGFCVLETHKPVPSGLIHLGNQLQQEANEIANQRLDNVKFVLNKRWFIRRGSNTDVDSLLRNVPGAVSLVNDVEKDVREINWADVTSSAYQEQDRINVDMDELLGSFAQSSVMTNRKLNETVGGMRMMAQGANVVTEYTLRVFVETWVEPTLRQLIKLEQYYESDEVVLSIAAAKAQLYQRFGMNPMMDSLLQQELTLSVNVGMGATDPDTRFQRFTQALGVYTQTAMGGPPDLNLMEVRKELFGLAGFKDSLRFFQPVDPRLIMMGQQVQQANMERDAAVNQAESGVQGKKSDLDKREMGQEVRGMKLDQQQQSMKAPNGQQ